MSTLKTINIIHPSGSTNNIVNDASGNITVGGTATVNTVTSAAATALTIKSAGTTAMTVDTSQNVGIGTASPGFKTEIVCGYNNGLQVKDTTATVYGGFFTEAAGMALVTRSNHQLRLGTNDTTRMTIDSSGNLLVGTTSNNGTITSFNASASGRAGFFMINAASSLSADAVGISKFDNNTTTSQVFVKFFINNNGSASGLITASGANQAAFTSSSDARLKENITPLAPQLEKICALKPCEFDYKDGTGRQTGFIAQEVREIYPDLIGESADGMLTLADMNKNDARLIKAIQELSAKVTALEGKV